MKGCFCGKVSNQSVGDDGSFPRAEAGITVQNIDVNEKKAWRVRLPVAKYCTRMVPRFEVEKFCLAWKTNDWMGKVRK